MGYIFRVEDAQRYSDWFQSEPGRSASAIEKELLLRIWAPSSPQTVLEVGCGTGIFLEWLNRLGHRVTGIEPSPFMLDIAAKRLPACVTLDRGYAEHLPYDDNSFDTVALITTLEFVDDPTKALLEALRVARRHVLVGALNTYSLITWQRRLKRFWRRKPSVFNHARYFSVFELEYMVERALSGSVPVRWRTCFFFPLSILRYTKFLERSRFFQWHPFGHFIAMRIDLHYNMRTIQEPLFCELPSGIGHAGFHISCWHSPRKRRCRQPSIPGQILIKTNGRHPEKPISA